MHPLDHPRGVRPRLRVTLVGDAHTTEDLTEWGAPPPEQVIAHTNLYWGFQSGPGRTAETVPADEVSFA